MNDSNRRPDGLEIGEHSGWRSGCAGASRRPAAADVTYERLLKPEPHNWLMVHHDYGAQRHSALDQINKSNIKNMKLKFAVAIGGTSPNEALEATPLVDDGFMYVVDGWGVGLQDRRALRHARPHAVEDGPRPGEVRPPSRRRAVGQSRDLDHRQGRPRDRDRQGDRQDRLGQEPARSAGGGIVVGAARAQGRHHRRRLGRRSGRARLDRLARSEDRQPEMEDLCGAGAGRARQRDLEGQEQRLADRRRRVLRHRLLRSGRPT